MAKQLQLRRGTTVQNDAFTGAIGELTMDTDKKQLRLHDGATLGGCGTIDPVVAFQVPTSANNYTWYRKYASGWVEQGGVFKASSNAGGTNTVINLPVTMADTHYTATLGLGDTDTNNNGVYMWFCEKTTTTLKTVSSLVDYTATESGWRVEGMAA
jgi:hypothetical protein